jgi:hypothetical protein
MPWLRHLAVLFAFIAALVRPAPASALSPASPESRVRGFEIAAHLLAGELGAASREQHQGIGAAYDENASGYRFAAGGAIRATGQLHHAISRPIHRALQEHRVLRGVYEARDPRFVLRAADEAAHRGYQQWHRALDQEVVEWLGRNPNATPAQFESYLRSVYQRPDLVQRFPLGFE